MQKTHLAAAVALALAAQAAHAIDIDAGDYTALPEGTNVAAVYVQHAERDKLYANDQQVPGRNGLDSNIGILRMIHFMKIGGFTVDPQFLLPFGQLKAKDDLAPALGQRSGVGDLILAATVWTLNDPEHRRWFGITPFVYAPTGTYDASRPLNLGENRWKYALQAAYLFGVGPQWTFDLAADVMLYGRNDDAGGGQSLKQDASTQLQAFARYQLSPAWDLRAGLSYARTGETKLAGVGRNDAANITKLQVGTAVFVGPTTQLMANIGQDLKVDNGFKEKARVNLRLLQLF